MDKDLLDGVVAFLAVAERRSFTLASADLGVTPTAVSKAVSQFERKRGVVLFLRTTRSVALTEAGAVLFARLRPAAEEIDDAIRALSGQKERPTGTLRLILSRMAMALLVQPLVPEFRRRYPEVTLDLSRTRSSATSIPAPSTRGSDPANR